MAVFLYFGYGSNMMTMRLTNRCVSARPVSIAFADGYSLTFWKPSDDGSGKGHLAHSAGSSQPGVLFEIDIKDQPELDRFEGVGNGYRREDSFSVRRGDNGNIINAVTYLATDLDESRQPYDWYLALIVTGAREHELGVDLIRQLLNTPSHPDPLPNRRRRLEAIELLTRAKTDIATVLRLPVEQ
jgi:gamma-glutamylcyclotransferase